MEGSILNNLGFDPVYLLIASAILTLILMVVTILCLINMRKLYRRYDIFMRGKDAESMENMIVDQMNAIIELQSQDRYNKYSIRYQYRICIEFSPQSRGLLSVFKGCGTW